MQKITEGFFQGRQSSKTCRPPIISINRAIEEVNQYFEALTHSNPAQPDLSIIEMVKTLDIDNVLSAVVTNSSIRIIIEQALKLFGTDISLNWINVSNVTCMDNIFEDLNFRGDVSNWDVSNVRSMGATFKNCQYFNGKLSKWDVTNVTLMSQMFENCTNFTGDLSAWDVSSVKDMSWMFQYCEKFNSDISQWDVSLVEDMYEMFDGCTSFNIDISRWDISNVADVGYMFCGCSNFCNDLSRWDMSNMKNRASSEIFWKCPMKNIKDFWPIGVR